MSNFVAKHKREWSELERLVKNARGSVRRLSAEDISRLDILYRRATVHLAQASTRTRDRALIQYLNELTASAHSLIYLPAKPSKIKSLVLFFTDGFARSVIRTWRFQVLSLAVFLIGWAVGFFAVSRDTTAAYALMPAGEFRMPGSTREQLQEVLQSGRDQGSGEKMIFSTFLFQHNFKVGILSIATGALAGIPCLLLIIYNGMIIGVFAAVHHQAGLATEMWAWILPHGITEIGAIILCGGVGLSLGFAVIAPGLRTRTEALVHAGKECAYVVMGIGIMLCMAALIESFVRQSHMSTSGRLWFAAGTAVFWGIYFFRGYLLEARAKQLASA